jgi:hypothetical protein
MINEMKDRRHEHYKNPYRKHHNEFQRNQLYSTLLDLYRDIETYTDHENELLNFLMSADMDWNDTIDRENNGIEDYLSDERLKPYSGILYPLMFNLNSNFKMAGIKISLPSTAIDHEFNELELYWNVKEYKLLIQIEVETAEVNGVLYYNTPHKTYCFEFDTDIENIPNQIIAVIQSTK